MKTYILTFSAYTFGMRLYEADEVVTCKPEDLLDEIKKIEKNHSRFGWICEGFKIL